MRVRDDVGHNLNATIGLEEIAGGVRILFESQGPKRNTDYVSAFDLILTRLAKLRATLLHAAVVSAATKHLSFGERRLVIESRPYPIQLEPTDYFFEIGRLLRGAAARVGRRPGAGGGGNPTKRVEVLFKLPDRDPVPFSWIADRLGLSTDAAFEGGVAGEDWTENEVSLIIRDYFEMLTLEVDGQPYNKAARNRALRETMRSRSQGSIERKHRNISWVLHTLRLRSIVGYKPLQNAQGLLFDAVREYIESNGLRVARVLAEFEKPPPPAPTPASFTKALVATPANQGVLSTTARNRSPRKLDFAQQDERNRALGRNGEQWVVELERDRLSLNGRQDLAAKVEWVANTQGDGAGYDVLSKDLDGADRFIEVKTTTGGKLTPFVLTACELACSREYGSRFQLYRVFDFKSKPKFFMVPGPLDTTLTLEPCEFRARFRRN
jgi:hypothetical protein